MPLKTGPGQYSTSTTSKIDSSSKFATPTNEKPTKDNPFHLSTTTIESTPEQLIDELKNLKPEDLLKRCIADKEAALIMIQTKDILNILCLPLQTKSEENYAKLNTTKSFYISVINKTPLMEVLEAHPEVFEAFLNDKDIKSYLPPKEVQRISSLHELKELKELEKLTPYLLFKKCIASEKTALVMIKTVLINNLWPQQQRDTIIDLWKKQQNSITNTALQDTTTNPGWQDTKINSQHKFVDTKGDRGFTMTSDYYDATLGRAYFISILEEHEAVFKCFLQAKELENCIPEDEIKRISLIHELKILEPLPLFERCLENEKIASVVVQTYSLIKNLCISKPEKRPDMVTTIYTLLIKIFEAHKDVFKNFLHNKNLNLKIGLPLSEINKLKGIHKIPEIDNSGSLSSFFN